MRDEAEHKAETEGLEVDERRCREAAGLKIALISPVWFPVPPTGYGGIEWIVWLLADGLVDAGHDVTLFASGDSHTKAKLASVFDHAAHDVQDAVGRCLGHHTVTSRAKGLPFHSSPGL